jgi:hypothetical protein
MSTFSEKETLEASMLTARVAASTGDLLMLTSLFALLLHLKQPGNKGGTSNLSGAFMVVNAAMNVCFLASSFFQSDQKYTVRVDFSTTVRCAHTDFQPGLSATLQRAVDAMRSHFSKVVSDAPMEYLSVFISSFCTNADVYQFCTKVRTTCCLPPTQHST